MPGNPSDSELATIVDILQATLNVLRNQNERTQKQTEELQRLTKRIEEHTEAIREHFRRPDKSDRLRS